MNHLNGGTKLHSWVSVNYFSSLESRVAKELPSTVHADEIKGLIDFLNASAHLVAITGAGISTASGIPDYRGPNGSYKRGHKPVNHTDFVRNEFARKRYWARSLIGWKTFSHAKPNDAHFSLAQLELKGILKYTVTQNVDRLHQAAGSREVVDLHGRNDHVRCLSCQTTNERQKIQQALEVLNPEFVARVMARNLQLDKNLRADGDIELGDEDFSQVCSVKIQFSLIARAVLFPETIFILYNFILASILCSSMNLFIYKSVS